ncbi:MAG: hypothetical protein P8X73_18755, partial [Ignavibacteriaceae bacterium]
YISNYYHINEPDGIVDMIVIIWRGLVLSDNWCGEASLGRGPEFWVEDNQVKIKMGYGVVRFTVLMVQVLLFSTGVKGIRKETLKT